MRRPLKGRREAGEECAPGCPVDEGTVPTSARNHKTIAVHQYEALTKHPYEYTEGELSREVHIVRRGKSEGELNLDEYDLRRSRLAKEFGWGIHYDELRRLALIGRETEEYDRLAGRAQARGTAVRAYRNRRAR